MLRFIRARITTIDWHGAPQILLLRQAEWIDKGFPRMKAANRSLDLRGRHDIHCVDSVMGDSENPAMAHMKLERAGQPCQDYAC